MSPSKKLQLAILFAVAPTGFVLAEDNSAAADVGQSVYEASCKSCHSGGIAGFFSGAPETGDKKDWAPLIEKGLAALIESSVNGFGDMKPRGGCATCSDDDIAAAVKYMVEQSR